MPEIYIKDYKHVDGKSTMTVSKSKPAISLGIVHTLSVTDDIYYKLVSGKKEFNSSDGYLIGDISTDEFKQALIL